MPNNGAWTNTPTVQGKVTIPKGYHNGNGYVDTTAVYNKGYANGVADTKTNITIDTSITGAQSKGGASGSTFELLNYTIPYDGKMHLVMTANNSRGGIGSITAYLDGVTLSSNLFSCSAGQILRIKASYQPESWDDKSTFAYAITYIY